MVQIEQILCNLEDPKIAQILNRYSSISPGSPYDPHRVECLTHNKPLHDINEPHHAKIDQNIFVLVNLGGNDGISSVSGEQKNFGIFFT